MDNQELIHSEFLRFEDAKKENMRMMDKFVYAGTTGIVGILIINFNLIINSTNKIFISICLYCLVISMFSHFISYLFSQKQAEYFIKSLTMNLQETDNCLENKRYIRNIKISNYLSYISLFLSVLMLLISVSILIHKI
jgi:hypothetical protein